MHFAVVFLYLNAGFKLVYSFENGTELSLSSNAEIDITNTVTDVFNSSVIPNTVSDISDVLQMSSALSDVLYTITSNSDIATEVANTATDTSNALQRLSNNATYNSNTMTYTSEKVSDVTSTTTLVSNEDYSILEGKHESLSTCPIFPLEPPDYKLLSNGTVWIEAYRLLLNDSHYILNNDILMFCIPFTANDSTMVFEEHILNTSHLTLIGLGISMISLLLHLIVFSIVPDLRNLPGWNLAALCSSLFVSYLLIFIIGTGEATKIPEMCIALAFLTHFFMLASIVWMSVMSYDVFVSLMRATGSFRISSNQFKWKKFGIYCSFAFGVALLFAFSSLLAEVLDIVPQPYKPMYKEMCWFSKKTPLLIFFAGPVIVLTCINLVFFALSAYTIHSNKMKSEQDEHKSILKRRYLMYFRLSVIMGITWIVGIVAAIFNEDWLWYLFVLLNTFQGFFIFLAFTCSKKVKKYFREKLFGERRGSQQTLSPTFQSYCFYANSIEKDLDKIVESSRKDKTDTIVIKL